VKFDRNVRTNRRHPRGYVLLLTLMLLAIAAAALAGACRAALQKAVLATRAQDDLQRRWGVVSCRAALLPKAERVLAASGDRTSPEARVEVTLGGRPMALVFGDEQAKANVNLLYALGHRDGADRAVRGVVGTIGADLRVELRPILIQAPDNDLSEPEQPKHPLQANRDEQELLDFEVQPVFEAWGQIFPGAKPTALLRRRGTPPSVAGSLTCWGDGTANVRRASSETLLRVCDGVLRSAEVRKLIAARDKDPDFDLWEVMDTLKLPDDRYDNAEQLLTDRSSCFSLWIVTRGGGGREWYDLAVSELAGGTGAGVKTFSW
jgi:hypothetical protein